MAKKNQFSFRLILLLWILPLSVVGLLLGAYFTYRKARSALLETARQNLTESAIRKGESIEASIKALQANLLTASQTTVLQLPSTIEEEENQKKELFLKELQQRLPTLVECLQLTEFATKKIVASTCGKQPIYQSLPPESWFDGAGRVWGNPVLPKQPLPNNKNSNGTLDAGNKWQLKLVLIAPVYAISGIGADNNSARPPLRYALSIQSVLEQRKIDILEARTGINEGVDGRAKSLTGQTVVLDVFDTTSQKEDATILEYPNFSNVGRNISSYNNQDLRKRLQSTIRNAISGKQDFLHLPDFDNPQKVELLSGYTALDSPLNPDRKWIILAVTPLDLALAGLKDIQGILFWLILGLLGANFVTAVLSARQLARPIETLQDYATKIQGDSSADKVRLNFHIQEFDRLGEALDEMVDRLRAWAQELQVAWTEANVANKLKNEFLATISHELRTPLNAIIGCIRLVRDDCCDDRAEEVEFLQRADDAAIHLLSIINDILDISKIEDGTLSVTMELLDLRKPLKEAIEQMESSIEQKGLELIYKEHPMPLMVEGDPGKLKQVFINLISNAIKFTEVGSITISTRIETANNQEMNSNNTDDAATEENRNISSWTVVSIQDTGIGIARERQEKLFQPFVMVDGSTTRRYGGAGLGLAISRNLIEMMGSKIDLYSRGVGEGTTVEVRLPTLDISPESSSIESSDSGSYTKLNGSPGSMVEKLPKIPNN
ncbi:MAG: HAMP domain-containing histidine kinase [Oscillatoria sp. SIO1A7]|nr:HAMP domain-containing histidine kinase [Oscillatoria sp. SIO1A7]